MQPVMSLIGFGLQEAVERPDAGYAPNGSAIGPDSASPAQSKAVLPLTLVSKLMIGVAVTMCALALSGIIFLLVLCHRKKNVDNMYTSYRPDEAILPELRGKEGFPTHSRNPSDGTGSLALARMTHLPAITFSEQCDDDFMATIESTAQVIDAQDFAKKADDATIVTVKTF
eukprot:scaffold143341_cov41-Prasinocladus_malaysianus.AAC.1